MANLEPIEEKDLDLEHKFKGGREDGVIKKETEQSVFQIEKEPAIDRTSAERDETYAKILSRVKKSTGIASSNQEVKEDAEKVYQKTDTESQIQHLVDLAMTKGVVHAVKVARHLEDNYVLDMFHDKLLADELRNALIQKGLIKEI